MIVLKKFNFLSRRFLLLLFIATAISIASFFLIKSNKSKEPAKLKVISNLFIYEDLVNKKEPSFSLKLPDSWYRDLGVRGKERLLSFSPDKSTKGITYRAAISAGVVPTTLDLAGEIARARKEIGLFAVDHKFITDKSINIKGSPAHLLEYTSILENDSQNVKQILGETGLRIHNTDIIVVKNGYFIDVSAYTYEWAWPEFFAVVEKSLNTLSFNPSN